MSEMTLDRPLPCSSVRRALAMMVAGATTLASMPASATMLRHPSSTSWLVVQASPAEEAGRLYAQGQDKFDSGDFVAAADDWTLALQQLPEDEQNRAIRETIVLSTVTAHREAYKKTQDLEQLRKAKTLLERYRFRFEKAYGEGARPSETVMTALDQVNDDLGKAERAATPTVDEPTKTEAKQPTVQPTTVVPPPAAPKAERDGIGLVASGAVFLGLGLGVLPMIVIGALGGVRATQDDATVDDVPEPQKDELRHSVRLRGRNMDAMLISSVVISAAFLITGSTLLGVGVRRRQVQYTLTPTITPKFAGMGLNLRF